MTTPDPDPDLLAELAELVAVDQLDAWLRDHGPRMLAQLAVLQVELIEYRAAGGEIPEELAARIRDLPIELGAAIHALTEG